MAVSFTKPWNGSGGGEQNVIRLIRCVYAGIKLKEGECFSALNEGISKLFRIPKYEK